MLPANKPIQNAKVIGCHFLCVYIHHNFLIEPMFIARRGCSLFSVWLLALMASASAARAGEQQFFACIKQYTAIGLSADAALAQCQKASLVGCIQKLLQGQSEPGSGKSDLPICDLLVGFLPETEIGVTARQLH